MELHQALCAARQRREHAGARRSWSATRSPTTGTSSSRTRRTGRPSANERAALAELADWLDRFTPATDSAGDAEPIQPEVYEIGKRHGFADDLRAWFRALYEILLGQSEGPRFGSFVAFYGPAETTALIRRALRGERPDQSAA